jgi:hypothetical protein
MMKYGWLKYARLYQMVRQILGPIKQHDKPPKEGSLKEQISGDSGKAIT